MNVEPVMALDRIACRGLVPGLTLLIDESEHYSLLRANQRERADFPMMIWVRLLDRA